MESLKLVALPLTRAAPAALGGLVHLKRLYLNDVAITDAGMVHLRRLTSLEVLSLRNAGITSAGLLGKSWRASEPSGAQPLGHERGRRRFCLAQGAPQLNTLVLKKRSPCRPAVRQAAGKARHAEPQRLPGLREDDRKNLDGLEDLRMLYLYDTPADKEKVEKWQEGMSGLAVNGH